MRSQAYAREEKEQMNEDALFAGVMMHHWASLQIRDDDVKTSAEIDFDFFVQPDFMPRKVFSKRNYVNWLFLAKLR